MKPSTMFAEWCVLRRTSMTARCHMFKSFGEFGNRLVCHQDFATCIHVPTAQSIFRELGYALDASLIARATAVHNLLWGDV